MQDSCRALVNPLANFTYMTQTLNTLRQQFFSSLKRGTGEAYLLMLANPDVDFSNYIIKGALTDFANDPQCEGGRAEYIYRFIKKAKQKEQIISAVLSALLVKKEDFWGLWQMCDLAVLFFRDGYEEARAALYTRFKLNEVEGYEFCGRQQLIEIDGLKGLLTVAETMGKFILEDNDWDDGWYVDRFQEENKTIDVYAALKKAGRKNKFINAFYKSVLEHKIDLNKEPKRERFSYELARQIIEAGKFAPFAYRARQLSEEEFERLAYDFINEKRKSKQEPYLPLFTKRKYPLDIQPLLDIVSGKKPMKKRVVDFAAEALSLFKRKDIRQLALDKLATTKSPDIYLSLLINNYKRGDHKLLSEIAGRSDNENYIHGVAHNFLSIYEANRTPECKTPLEIMYDKLNCGICRERIVQLLVDNNVLSEQIRQELRYDCNADIRKLYLNLRKNK